jgi:hypothetical protein
MSYRKSAEAVTASGDAAPDTVLSRACRSVAIRHLMCGSHEFTSGPSRGSTSASMLYALCRWA